MNAFLIKENRDFPLIKDYHSNLQSSLSFFIFFPSFCYIRSSCNKEKNKLPFLMQKMSLKLRVKTFQVTAAAFCLREVLKMPASGAIC